MSVESGGQCDHQVYLVNKDREEKHLEPVYQEIRQIRKQKEQEPAWAPKPSLIYGVITAKEVARYVPPEPVRIRVDGL